MKDDEKRGRGRHDPLWNSVSSFGIDELFVLPEWIADSPGESGDEGGEGKTGEVAARLASLVKKVGDCKGCRLHEKRNKIVFGDGNPASGILFIGEGPGANEDKQGKPFVGRAGQLLDKILASIDLDRSKVYITNIVKCRPPNNRTPSNDEVASCWWILEEQIKIMAPDIIVTLGAPAGRALLGSTDGIGKLRGTVHRRDGIPVIPTYHPAALLRTGALKRPVWEDMKMLRRMLDELGLPRREGEQ